MNNKILSTLSIAAKAGKLKSGEQMSEEAVRSRAAHLVIIANDSSERTKKRFIEMCDYYGVAVATYATKEELGHYIGKEFRAVVAVCDQGLAKSLTDKLATEVDA